jgi:3-polyprenyl-4-hydroxybenzoate decarboxylase
MSTAFHPQTDGLAEKVNIIIERYLRTFAAGNEISWAKLLPLAEFAYNASEHKGTNETPLDEELGYVAQMPLDIIAATTSANSTRQGGQQVVNFATTMADILAQLKDRLLAQAAQAAEANKKRQPHNFQMGDRVMINTRNMPLSYGAAALGTKTNQSGARLSRALQQQYAGPYTLGKQRGNGNFFEIADMPQHLRIHKTFNVSKFKRCTIEESRLQDPPPPIRVTKSGKVEQGVEAIREWRTSEDGNAQFREQRDGKSEEESSWELLTSLTRFGARETVQEYTATLNDEKLNKLLPKNLRPATLSATTRSGTIKTKGLLPTKRSPRIAARAT